MSMNADILFGDGKSLRNRGKSKCDHGELRNVVKAIPFYQQRFVRKLGARCGIARSSIHINMNPIQGMQGDASHHQSSVKALCNIDSKQPG
jgi:hypothetical protein